MSYPYPQQGGQGYAATGYPQGGAGYHQGGVGYPQGGAGYPRGGAGYPQGGAGYPQGGAGYPQGGAGYPQGGAAPPYPPAGATSAPYQGGSTPYPQSGPYPGQPLGAPPYPPASGYPQGPPAGGAGPVVPTFKGDVPAEDMKDDPNAQPPAPSAPTLDQMGKVPGYENVGFNAATLPPPSYEEATSGPPPERREFRNAPTVSESEARETLIQYVSERCCYGKGAASDMRFQELKSSSAFHYTLETFTESRSTCWAYEPYQGQDIDGPERGPAPGPWDIQTTAPNLFQSSRLDIEVPHTACVRPCHNCFCQGYTRCFRCQGRGHLFCHSCNGSGHRRVVGASMHHNMHHRHHFHHHHIHQSEACLFCHGTGRRRCYTCNGFGQVECPVCMTRCNLKCFIKLTIIWNNHVKDHVVERTALPDHLIRNVSGQTAFEEQMPRVWPINHFPDQEVNSVSMAIVTEQSRAYPAERILMQRHHVRIVPVTQANYTWKNKSGSFFVYGAEHKVYAPDYPQQYCWGCTIL